MSTVTLSSLRTQARQRADMENSGFIKDSELNGYINSSYAELYDILVSKFEDYHTKTASATISGSSTSFPVPSDFYKLRGVDRLISGTEYYSLPKWNFAERNFRDRSIISNVYGHSDLSYRLITNSVEIVPTQRAAGTYRIWYVPHYTQLSLDADTLDGVNGWEEYIVVDAAIKMLIKEESSTTALEGIKESIRQRIETMAANRDFDQPESITDVQSSFHDPYDIFF